MENVDKLNGLKYCHIEDEDGDKLVSELTVKLWHMWRLTGSVFGKKFCELEKKRMQTFVITGYKFSPPTPPP